MFKFRRRRRGKDAAGPNAGGPLVVRVTGGLPDDEIGNEPLIMRFTTDAGQKVIVHGGLPDLLMGEANPEDRIIYTGTSVDKATNAKPS